MPTYHCQSCGTALQGNSILCVSCYRAYLVVCPDCVVAVREYGLSIRRDPKTKKNVNCKYCKNERWILTWESNSAEQKTL